MFLSWWNGAVEGLALDMGRESLCILVMMAELIPTHELGFTDVVERTCVCSHCFSQWSRKQGYPAKLCTDPKKLWDDKCFKPLRSGWCIYYAAVKNKYTKYQHIYLISDFPHYYLHWVITAHNFKATVS